MIPTIAAATAYVCNKLTSWGGTRIEIFQTQVVGETVRIVARCYWDDSAEADTRNWAVWLLKDGTLYGMC